VVALVCCVGGHAELSSEEDASVGRDVALFADGYACGEEPQADRLRASSLLALAGRGRPATDVIEARQRFTDGLRARMKGPRPGASACDAATAALRARLAEFDSR
jgi:hypothetical protein